MLGVNKSSWIEKLWKRKSFENFWLKNIMKEGFSLLDISGLVSLS